MTSRAKNYGHGNSLMNSVSMLPKACTMTSAPVVKSGSLGIKTNGITSLATAGFTTGLADKTSLGRSVVKLSV